MLGDPRTSGCACISVGEVKISCYRSRPILAGQSVDDTGCLHSEMLGKSSVSFLYISPQVPVMSRRVLLDTIKAGPIPALSLQADHLSLSASSLPLSYLLPSLLVRAMPPKQKKRAAMTTGG